MIPSIWTSRIFSFGVAILVSVSWPHQRRDDSNKDFESVIHVYRDSASGICSLKVNGLRLQQAASKPQVFRFINLWRYDPATGKWVKERWEGVSAIRMQDIERSTHRSQTDQTLLALPRKVGLFWVEWAEDEREANSLAVCGPVLCNDIDLAEPPNGRIAACVPFAASATAMFVPDPRTHRRE